MNQKKKEPKTESIPELSPEQIEKENKMLDEIQAGFSGVKKDLFIKARKEHPPVIHSCGLKGFEGGFLPDASGKMNFWFNDIDESTYILNIDSLSE